MNFEIKNPKKGRLHGDERKLIVASVVFFILAIIFIIIYLTKVNTQLPQKSKEQKNIPKETLKVVDENDNKRPIAVMIDNNIGEEKHAGLQASFVNYEIIVEGGLSRIMAIYKEKANTLIGPVRSSRHYFLDYALEYNAIYSHFGWSPKAEEDIKNLNVQNINGMVDSACFARDKTIPAPHNVFTSTAKLRECGDIKGYSSTTNSWKALNYSIQEVNLDQNDKTSDKLQIANNITMKYSYSQTRSYIYDVNSRKYLRFMNGKAHLDKETDNQLNFKNIIIMKVENEALDNEDRQDLKTIGQGTGYYITNGYSVPINWIKSSRTAKTKYTYETGQEIKVNDGNTFIQIIPVSSDISIE